MTNDDYTGATDHRRLYVLLTGQANVLHSYAESRLFAAEKGEDPIPESEAFWQGLVDALDADVVNSDVLSTTLRQFLEAPVAIPY